MTHLDPNLFSAAKVLHVILAVVWAGGALYVFFVVGPILRQSTLGTQREFTGRLMPVAARFGNIVGGLTVLSGLGLWYLRNHSFEVLTLPDRLIAFGFVLGLSMLYLLNFALRPTAKAILKIMANHPPNEPPPQIVGFLQRRIAWVTALNAGLMITTVVVMVLANAPPAT